MTIEMFFMFFIHLVFVLIGTTLSVSLYMKSRQLKHKRDLFWATAALITITTVPYFLILGEIIYFITGNSLLAGAIYKMNWQFSANWFAVFILFFMGENLKLDVMKNSKVINTLIVFVMIFSSFYEFGRWNLRLEDGGILDVVMNAFARDVMLSVQGFFWLIVFSSFAFLFFSKLVTSRGSDRTTERYKGYLILFIVGFMIPLTDIPAAWGNTYNTYLLYVSNFWMLLWILFYYFGINKLLILPRKIQEA